MAKDKSEKEQLLEQVLPQYRSYLSDEDYDKLLASIQQPLHTSIRLNPLKTDPQQAIKTLVNKYEWQVEPIPFCEQGWWVTAAETEPSKTIEHRMGQYYIQDAASMLPPELFDFDDTRRPLILDMAASPGGKTTHLISKINDRGLVIANDASRSRLTALRLVLQNWGAINKVVTNLPGERFADLTPNTFDRILLDAPCSMESLRSLDSHPMRSITTTERESLANRQFKLLESALKTVRVGGQVVYSTCTLSPQEDEAVLNKLMEQYPIEVSIESVTHKLPFNAPGLVSDHMQEFDPQVKNAVRLWPHISNTSGFFAALLTKTDHINTTHSHIRSTQNNRKPISTRLGKKEKINLIEDLQKQYGLDIIKILEDHNASLWIKDKQILIMPEVDLELLNKLSFSNPGLKLGEYHPRGFLLSNEFVSRFYRQCSRSRYILPESTHAQWLRGEDIRRKPLYDFPTGTVVIMVDEQETFLGLGRILSDRLKNLLPKRIVL